MPFLARALTAALLAFMSCSRADPPAPTAPPTPAAPADPPHLQVTQAPVEGAVDAIVRAALDQAAAGKRTLIVYVGAVWCEPCQRFHRAAESGELDATFPRLTMLEFDSDRDAARLRAAGYVSAYIPLFALPARDGRASGKQVEGGIKGDGAVAYMVPRLKELLSQ
jgi:hypothetical protein